jgi:hypothetical protein
MVYVTLSDADGMDCPPAPSELRYLVRCPRLAFCTQPPSCGAGHLNNEQGHEPDHAGVEDADAERDQNVVRKHERQQREHRADGGDPRESPAHLSQQLELKLSRSPSGGPSSPPLGIALQSPRRVHLSTVGVVARRASGTQCANAASPHPTPPTKQPPRGNGVHHPGGTTASIPDMFRDLRGRALSADPPLTDTPGMRGHVPDEMATGATAAMCAVVS